MAPALDDVASGETLAKTRRHDWSSCPRESHLAAMCVTRQRQRDPCWHIGKNVRVVRQEQNRDSIRWHRSERC